MSAVIENSLKIRDLPPTAIRLKPELKAKIAREAAINGRSLHAEILLRLEASVDVGGRGEGGGAHRVEEQGSKWLPNQTDAERALISIYKRLSPERQLALLTLLK